MIFIKDTFAIKKMVEVGKRLSAVFVELSDVVKAGCSTVYVDTWIEKRLESAKLQTEMKGYCGYKHVSCISINDEVVHGVPSVKKMIKDGDLVKVDVCASFEGYCADMARPFFVGTSMPIQMQKFVFVAKESLDVGIGQMVPNNHVSDISFAIQNVVLKNNYGIVREFSGHGIGENMHEDPNVSNYGNPGRGPILKIGMAFAIEPMITVGHPSIVIDKDGWTARTVDGSLAMHIEDTVVLGENGPIVTTAIFS